MRIRLHPNGGTQPLVVASLPATWSEFESLAQPKLQFQGATGQKRFYLDLDGAEVTDLNDIEAGDSIAVAFNGEPFRPMPSASEMEGLCHPPIHRRRLTP